MYLQGSEEKEMTDFVKHIKHSKEIKDTEIMRDDIETIKTYFRHLAEQFDVLVITSQSTNRIADLKFMTRQLGYKFIRSQII